MCVEEERYSINIQGSAFVHGSNKIPKVPSICQSVLNDLCVSRPHPFFPAPQPFQLLPPSAALMNCKRRAKGVSLSSAHSS